MHSDLPPKDAAAGPGKASLQTLATKSAKQNISVHHDDPRNCEGITKASPTPMAEAKAAEISDLAKSSTSSISFDRSFVQSSDAKSEPTIQVQYSWSTGAPPLQFKPEQKPQARAPPVGFKQEQKPPLRFKKEQQAPLFVAEHRFEKEQQARDRRGKQTMTSNLGCSTPRAAEPLPQWCTSCKTDNQQPKIRWFPTTRKTSTAISMMRGTSIQKRRRS